MNQPHRLRPMCRALGILRRLSLRPSRELLETVQDPKQKSLKSRAKKKTNTRRLFYVSRSRGPKKKKKQRRSLRHAGIRDELSDRPLMARPKLPMKNQRSNGFELPTGETFASEKRAESNDNPQV